MDVNKRIIELEEELNQVLQVANMKRGGIIELKALLKPIKKPDNDKPKVLEEIKKETTEQEK